MAARIPRLKITVIALFTSLKRPFRVVLGVSGASGMILTRILLRTLAALPNIETRVIVTRAARAVMLAEGESEGNTLKNASHIYEQDDFAAPPASGSWRHDGMIVCPCSMSSLAAIATGAGTTLLHRAADVALKEGRPLVLVPRETPLNLVHLKNMVAAKEAGAIIMPFMPAFYANCESVEATVCQFAGRIIDQLGLEHTLCARWGETADQGNH